MTLHVSGAHIGLGGAQGGTWRLAQQVNAAMGGRAAAALTPRPRTAGSHSTHDILVNVRVPKSVQRSHRSARTRPCAIAAQQLKL